MNIPAVATTSIPIPTVVPVNQREYIHMFTYASVHSLADKLQRSKLINSWHMLGV